MKTARRIIPPALFAVGLSLISWPDWRALYGAFMLAFGVVVFWKVRE